MVYVCVEDNGINELWITNLPSLGMFCPLCVMSDLQSALIIQQYRVRLNY